MKETPRPPRPAPRPPRQAWVLEWELLVLQDSPWTPEAWEVNQLAGLFHWEPDSPAH